VEKEKEGSNWLVQVHLEYGCHTSVVDVHSFDVICYSEVDDSSTDVPIDTLLVSQRQQLIYMPWIAYQM